MAKIFGHLLKEVVAPGFCLGCGACVASCPFNVLELVDGKPKLIGKCEACEICYAQCPQTAPDESLQGLVFNETSEDPLGFYRRAISAKALDGEILARGQDGGLVTSMLAALLERGSIDGAVVVAHQDWLPQPKVATSKPELVECAGSKYSRAPVLLGLEDAVELYMLERIALVGLPCQIKAFRRMQLDKLAVPKLADRVKLCVGLFCMETFTYGPLFKQTMEGQLGLNLKEITKLDIKKGKFLIYSPGKPPKELDLSSMKQFVDLPCKLCADFTSELADISVGSIGSPLGCSTALLRTEAGAKAFEAASGSLSIKREPNLDLVRRTSAHKKKLAASEVEQRRKSGQPLPSRLG